MIYPNKLSDGDIIKIISPSNGVKEKKHTELDKAEDFLKSKGFTVKEDKYVRNSNHGMSAEANDRVAELNDAICDKKSKALIACSGGDYLVQILHKLNFDTFKENVKWIQGQSDITGLLYYLTTKYDIASIYNFNVKTYGDSTVPSIMLDNGVNALKNTLPMQKVFGVEQNQKELHCITNFEPIEGRIIGGCLDSLKDLIGTKYDCTKNFIHKYKDNGIIWYFDVAEMTNEDIMRTMWQLKEAGWFKYCKGILFGRLYEEKTYTNISLKDAVNYFLQDLNVPILINADIGHTDPVITIINGSYVKIDNQDGYTLETYLK